MGTGITYFVGDIAYFGGEMKVKDLKLLIESPTAERYMDLPVSIILSKPSVGPLANCPIKAARFGIDWDRGLMLEPTSPLVIKTLNEEVFDKSRDLLIYLATKPCKKMNYETRTARNILIKLGYTEDKLNALSQCYHR